MRAEDQVANHYQKRGYQIAAQRWRGQAGEVDLVLRKQAMLVFVEVKRARSFAIAAERVTQRQLARIIATASEFVATEPAGQDSEMRFDAALVDEIGRIEIRENILAW